MSKKRRVRPTTARHKKILARDNYECLRCGSKQNLTVDHIKPTSKGGKNAQENLQTLCKDCNQLKANKSISYLDPDLYSS